MIIDPIFDHTDDNFVQAIGVTDEEHTVALATVIYETIVPNLQASALYDNPEDVPSEMNRTRSQILENCFKRLVDKHNTRFALMLIFQQTYEKARIQMEDVIDMISKSDELSNRIKADSLENAISQVVSKIKLMPMIAMMKFLKKNNFDYEKFIDYVNSEMEEKSDSLDPEKDYSDIDEMIRKAMEDEDDNKND